MILLVACETSHPARDVAPAPAPTVTASPAPAAIPKPLPTACAADSECSFADPRTPERCVASTSGASTSPGGACVCFEGRCAMRPSSPRISQQTCKDSGDCDVDVTTGQCEPNIVSDDEFRVRFSGPICRCLPKDSRCHLRWVEPVACKTADDCWLEELPLLHAIPRPKRLKGKKFRPCVDGEHEPACIQGTCTIRGFTC